MERYWPLRHQASERLTMPNSEECEEKKGSTERAGENERERERERGKEGESG